MSCPDRTLVEMQLCPHPWQPPAVPSTSGWAEGQPRRRRALGLQEDIASVLQQRKVIMKSKQRLSIYSLLLAAVGIGLMITSTELCLNGSDPLTVELLSIAVSVSTFLLLILILAYHVRDIQLFTIDEGIREWRVALSGQRKLQLTLELLVCSLHPFPLAFQGSSAKDDTQLPVSVIVLSNLMFLRVYLVPRALFMSSSVLNPSYQTIGSLNKINLRFHFVLKVLMDRCPGKTLLLFVLFVWCTASWAVSLCERHSHNNSTNNIINSMWLIPITFLTIGYGDTVPVTMCGKFICLITGLTGVSCTALFITVIAKKLEFDKDEKHVHHFMLDIQLTKEVQKVAADLIGVSWLLYKHRKSRNMRKIRKCHRDVLATVCRFRKIKLKRRKLQEQVSTMMDISKVTDINVSSASRSGSVEPASPHGFV
ncbi:intermediate conductance calcium-activated potassium channel protein 4-like isoform X2 [Stegostoma tigrinum]|uniref:intermediate conductance calcium-activated potassium channel protein 4-like isoform X2 n=1 Tax=Stegostoma tigrinum TaxID=3053191 RepID=UPI002870AEE4|nr:intermediate conductance calcium-activated potassium channel protein 4-like isoform X2 [Stegostoma tigrinum]